MTVDVRNLFWLFKSRIYLFFVVFFPKKYINIRPYISRVTSIINFRELPNGFKIKYIDYIINGNSHLFLEIWVR